MLPLLHTCVNESKRVKDEAIWGHGGGKLIVHGSSVLAERQALAARGVHVISCLTWLEEYGLTEQLAVEVNGGMPDVIAAQWGAQKVITLEGRGSTFAYAE